MAYKATEKMAYGVIDHDPNASDTMTNVNSTAWVDMAGWNQCTFIAIRTVGTGKIQKAGVYASAASTGTSAVLVGTALGSTNATGCVLANAHGTAGAPDVGRVIMTVSANEVGTAVENGRYVGLRLSMATGTDEMTVLFILSDPRVSQVLTASNVNSGNDL